MTTVNFNASCPSCHQPAKLKYVNCIWECHVCHRTWVFVVDMQYPRYHRNYPGIYSMSPTHRNKRLKRFFDGKDKKITGQHYDHLIFDDITDPLMSPESRHISEEELRKFFEKHGPMDQEDGFIPDDDGAWPPNLPSSD